MATYKRRIVYLSDEEWSLVADQAKARGRTVSGQIRAALRGWADTGYDGESDLPPTVRYAEAADNAAEAIEEFGRSFNSRPFTPVPKSRK